MSEEIKGILNKFDKVLENYELDKKFKQFSVDSICHLFPNEMLTIKNTITSLQQKVEQLEKENKELKQPQVFIDCENMEERYGRDLYEDYLKEKIEQLENIRKEAIKATKDVKQFVYDELVDRNVSGATETHCKIMNLLNILNKGE